jgi:hypothetical protein
VARYTTPGCSVPSMRWSHPPSECARSAAAPERDDRGSSIALTNTASNTGLSRAKLLPGEASIKSRIKIKGGALGEWTEK